MECGERRVECGELKVRRKGKVDCKVEWKVDLKVKRTVGRGKRASRACDEACKGFINRPLGTGK